MAVAPTLTQVRTTGSAPARRKPQRGWVFHAVMAPVALLWILPVLFVIMIAFRSFDDIATRGLGAWPKQLTPSAFRTAWVGGNIGGALLNTVGITVGAAAAVLLPGSPPGFAV